MKYQKLRPGVWRFLCPSRNPGIKSCPIKKKTKIRKIKKKQQQFIINKNKNQIIIMKDKNPMARKISLSRA